MDTVKFIALDKEDLEVVSAHLQDAEITVADVHWRPGEKRLVLAVDRFDWPAAIASVPELRRCRAALRFERVLACKCKNVNPAGKDQVLNLLAVEFAESSPPGGVVTLTFSGGRRCGSRSGRRSARRPGPIRWPTRVLSTSMMARA
jgi:hypothetical protein